MPYLLATSAVWALSFGLIKGRLTGLDPAGVAAIRLGLAACMFLPWWRGQGLTRRQHGELVVMGAVQFGLMYVLYNAAFAYLQAWQVALFSITTPLHVMLIDQLLERRWRVLPVILASTAVAAAALLQTQNDLSGDVARGMWLVQGSNAAFGSGQVAYQRWRRRHAQVRDHRVHGLMFASGAALAAVAATLGNGWPALETLNPERTAVLLYLGMVASGLGFWAWNRGATQVSAPLLAVMNNLKAPLAVAASLWVFGENADTSRLLLSAVLLGAAIGVARWDHQDPLPLS